MMMMMTHHQHQHRPSSTQQKQEHDDEHADYVDADDEDAQERRMRVKENTHSNEDAARRFYSQQALLLFEEDKDIVEEVRGASAAPAAVGGRAGGVVAVAPAEQEAEEAIKEEEDEDEDADATPLERFERAQARLLQPSCTQQQELLRLSTMMAVVPPSHQQEQEQQEQQEVMTTTTTTTALRMMIIEQQQQALLLMHPQPTPTMQVREARASLGYDPFVGAVAGLPWTAAERRAWGENSYGAIRRTHELRYARILKGGGVIRFDLVPIDEDADQQPEQPHDDAEQQQSATAGSSSSAGSSRSGTNTTTPTTMMVVGSVLTEVQALRELRSVTFLWRRAPDKDLVPARFVDHWLYLDRQARTYAAVVFDPRHPPGDMTMTTMRPMMMQHQQHQQQQQMMTMMPRWNTWTGLRASRLPPPLPPMMSIMMMRRPPPSSSGGSGIGTNEHTHDNNNNTTATNNATALINDHILRVVCAGNRDHAEWFLDYFAAIVQRPWRRTGVAVLLTGLQGAGKNTVVDFFRERILGRRITSHLQNARRGLFGRFAAAHAKVVFIQGDEFLVGPGDAEPLKNLITGDLIRVERKYQDAVTEPNYSNLIATTNTPDGGLNLPPDDRRWAILRVSSERVGDHEYFARLHAACGSDVVARAFYDALMRRDVSARFGATSSGGGASAAATNTNNATCGQAARPITEHYRACVRAGISHTRRFLAAIIHARAYAHPAAFSSTSSRKDAAAALPPPSVLAADLYRDYCHFVTDARLPMMIGGSGSSSSVGAGGGSFFAFADELAQLMTPSSSSSSSSSAPSSSTQQQPPQHDHHDHDHDHDQQPEAEEAAAEDNQDNKKGDTNKNKKRKRSHQHREVEATRVEDGGALDRRRCRQGFYYRFDYGRLRALLATAGEYDPGAFLMRAPSAGYH